MSHFGKSFPFGWRWPDPEETTGTPVVTGKVYVAENGTTIYTAENGTTIYIPES